MYERPLVMIHVADLKPFKHNPRTHSDSQIQQIIHSIEEFGFTNPLLVDQYGGIIAGHGRLLAARRMGMETVPCIKISDLSTQQKQALVIADNKLALNAGWDEEILIAQLQELQAADFNIDLTGFGEDELADLLHTEFDPYNEGTMGSMAANYGVPPFSVLNAREGTWQDRKRYWIDKGIQSELGRDIGNTSASPDINRGPDEGGSIFDPVLCELMYAWFTGKGFMVLDPFAGGSVRGIVAAEMGRHYHGVELRAEQVEANIGQRDEICAGPIFPTWDQGDSREIIEICDGQLEADFVFSCPPYADLEVYSDDPADISNMEYEDFRKAYFDIVARSCRLLKDDRFACFVVGEVRDKKGHYYNFVGDTVQAFLNAGLEFYNEAILITPTGSLPLRAGKPFKKSRKLGKAHQNILVFIKGDPVKAAEACGVVDIPDLEEMEKEE